MMGFIVLGLIATLSVVSADQSHQAEPNAGQTASPENMFDGNLAQAPVNGSFKMKDYIVWGGSVTKGDDGKYYMFASRWPKSVSMRNWVVNSEIVLASSDEAAGPYKFEKVILPPRGPKYWDGMMTHNPSIHRHGDKYVLFYVGTTYDFELPTSQVSREVYGQVWNGKRIGVAVASSPFGPWKRQDEPVLQPRPGQWDGAITSNPAPVIHDDGSVLLIYKSAPVPYPERNKNRALHFGIATAPHYLGPYKRVNDGQKLEFAGAKNAHVEDPYIWQANGYYHMVAKAFGRALTGESGAGFYAHSKNGLEWSLPENPRAYSRKVLFSDGTTRTQTKLERPQVLVEDGKPTHIFFASADPKWADIYNLVIPLKSKHPQTPVKATTEGESTPNIIPWPAEFSPQPGAFTLSEKTVIQTDPAFSNEADLLAADLSLTVGTGTGITFKKVDGLAAEAYTLDVTPTGITIAATTPAGAFYGSQTLRQLVTDKNVPCCSIQDEPRIAWRGFMLDVSRHFFDAEQVKDRLDEMAKLKLNVFHWHLTDDHGWRIEIKKYPKLTTIGAWHPVGERDKGAEHIVDGQHGGFYTQEEIKEIVAYAAERHIRILPEIDMPGHMSAAAASYPEISPDNGWTPMVSTGSGRLAAICVARPKTVQFCKDVLEEVVALFPSHEIHVGGDEVYYDQWEACPEMRAHKKKLGAKDWVEVQIHFQNEISEFLVSKGRTAVFWNNIYRKTVDKRSINHFWRNMKNARSFANDGFDVLMSPYQYYLDHHEFNLEATYKYNPLAIGVDPGKEKHMVGIEACQWTERIPNEKRLINNIYPRLIAIAESGWTPEEKKSWRSFRERVVHCNVLPAELRDKIESDVSKINSKRFHSARPKRAKKVNPVPADNIAYWKSARFLDLKEDISPEKTSRKQRAVVGIDGNPTTAALPKNVTQGWSYDVNLESLHNAKQVKITFGECPSPPELTVRISADGIVWHTIYEKTPTDASPLTIDFTPAEIQFIRVTQKAHGDKAPTWMPIAELEAR